MSQSTTPVSTHAAQGLLRSDPEAATNKFGFKVSSSVYTHTTLVSCPRSSLRELRG